MMEKMYHYIDSGLPDIWLDGGVEFTETPDGPATAIQDIDGLHHLIAMGIIESVERTGRMTGPEFKFLRIELDMSQRATSQVVGVDANTIYRWEKGDVNVPTAAAKLLSMWYFETMTDERFKERMERIQQLDAAIVAHNAHERRLRHSDNGWEPTAA